MNYEIEITYNEFQMTSIIEKNGVQIDQYSSLSDCCNLKFDLWVEDIFDKAYNEVNTHFSIAFSGAKFFSKILEYYCAINCNCEHFRTITPEFDISTKTREQWFYSLASASNSIKSLLDTLQINIYVDNNNFDAIKSSFLQYKDYSVVSNKYYYLFSPTFGIPINISSVSDSNSTSTEVLNIYIVSNANSTPCSNGNAIYFHTNPLQKEIKCIGKTNTRYAFSGTVLQLPEFITMAMEAIIYPTVFNNAHIIAKSDKTIINNKEKEIQLMADALISKKPICHVSIPKRIELSKTESINIIILPHSKVDIAISKSGIINCTGKTVTGISPGKTDLSISLQGAKDKLYSGSIEVYEIIRVKSIKLSKSNSAIFCGDSFSINASFFPSNAVDIGSQKWSINNRHVLSDLGNGMYQAIAEGECLITVNVGSVSKSIKIHVNASAEKIKLPNQNVEIKISQPPKQIVPQVIPTSATNGSIFQQSANSSIAYYDDASQCVVPVNIGITTITFYLRTQKGIVDQQTLTVEILPPHKIQNPPASLVMMILCTILSIITLTTLAAPLFGIGVIGCAIWHFIAEGLNRRNIIEVIICTLLSWILILLIGGNII